MVTATLRGRGAAAWLLALMVLLVASAWAPKLRAQPKITTPVTDDANVLSTTERETIAARLLAHQQATGVQMAVVTVWTTGSFPIEDYTLRLAEEWAGGDEDRDDGVVYLLAVKDRKMRLEVGYGLEERIPDGVARSMIDATRPLLRKERYADAILAVVDSVALCTHGITPRTVLSRRPRPFIDLPFFSNYALAWTAGALPALILAVAARRKRRQPLEVDDGSFGSDAIDWSGFALELAVAALVGVGVTYAIARSEDLWAAYLSLAVVGVLCVLVAVRLDRRDRQRLDATGSVTRFIAIAGCAVLPWVVGALSSMGASVPPSTLWPSAWLHFGLFLALFVVVKLFQGASRIRLPRHGDTGWGAASATYASSGSAHIPFAHSGFSSSSSSMFSSSSSSMFSSSSSSVHASPSWSSGAGSSSSSSAYGGGGGSFGGGGASSSW